MKKLALLLAVAFGLAFSAQAQHARRVLVEEFTNASCPPCAAQNPSFNALLEANADYVTPIKYQVWWPGFDPMYNQTKPDVDPRVAYYGVSGVPNAFVNGGVVSNDCGYYEGAPACLSADEITDAYGNTTPVTIALTHALSADTKSVNINVDVTSDAALTGNLVLRVAVLEREITFLSAPGSNGEKDFSHVMRKMLPDAGGTATGNFTAGETKNFLFNWQLANFYNLNEVMVIAWLQNESTQEVWQSEQSLPNTVIPGGNYAQVNLSAAASYKLTCESNFNPTFNLKNVGTTALTSADIEYRVDGGAWNTYQWTGTLNPNLQTAVALPTVVFTTGGAHTIDIFISNTSNGTQLNQVSASGRITVNAFFESVQPPVADGFEAANFPPAGWGLKQSTGGDVWEHANVGAYDASDFSAAVGFYSIQSGTMEMYMPQLNILANSGQNWLTFDHAYTYYVSGGDVFVDRLVVEVSTNCGTNWTSVFDKSGDDLATAPAIANPFVPTGGDWVVDSINLDNFAGEEILVRFRAISGYGNNLFVDNVNVAMTSGVQNLLSLSGFTVQPNPARAAAELRFALDRPERLQMQLFSVDGALVESRLLGDLVAGQHVVALDGARLNAGSYRVVLQGQSGLAQTQWIVVK